MDRSMLPRGGAGCWRIGALLVLCTGVQAARSAPPPEPGDAPPTIEEVIVTAQKIEQGVREVPISMTVLDSKFLAQQAITDVKDAMLFVPNVKVESAGFFSAPRARGFSFNNNNKAFEPPLGLALDGVPYTNTTYFNAAVFDTKRIEVLRGPQGTTFGKNTTAGLINIVSNDPTADFNGYLDLQGGDYNHEHFEGGAGGPLLNNAVEFRIAGLIDRQSGFIRNTTHEVNPDVPAKYRGYKHEGFRAKLKFPDILFGSTLKLSAENVALDSYGAGEELWHASDAVKAFIRRFDPRADFTLGNYVASIDAPDYRLARERTYLAQLEHGFGDWNLTALAGYSSLSQTFAVDPDFTPVPAYTGLDGDKSPTTTVEIRGERPEFHGLFGLSSLFGLDLGKSDLLLGIFAQRRDINDSYFRFAFNDANFLALSEIAVLSNPGGATGVPNLNTPNIGLPGVLGPAGGVLGAATGLVPPAPGTQDDVTQFFNQRAETLAVYGQSRWQLRPQWSLQAGLRVSRELKHGNFHQVFNSPPPNAVLLASGLREFSAQGVIGETQYQPKITLGWEPNEDLNIYAHFALGFKGGGFNAFAFTGKPDQLSYKPEKARELGLDIKTGTLPGNVRFDLSFYRLEVSDFQVLGREKETGTIGLGITKVFNAPKARAQGAEGDFVWKPLRGFTVIGTLGFNDTRYLDFPNNECPADNSASTCNATGRPFAFAPRWDNTLTPMLDLPLGFGGLVFNSSFTIEQESHSLLDTDLDPRKTQPAFFRFRATVGLSSPEQGWSLRVIGQNLSDTTVSIRQGDLFSGLFINLQEPPRIVFAQFRLEF